MVVLSYAVITGGVSE